MKLFIKTHGDSKTRLYYIWKHMRQRCTNPNTEFWDNYGGRGITFIKEWDDYSLFKKWALENGYKNTLTIDRKNNNGNYEPENCRWVNESVQAQNKTIYKNNSSGFIGVGFHKSTQMYRTYISVNSKIKHLGIFNTAIEAAKARDNYIIENNLEHTKNFS